MAREHFMLIPQSDTCYNLVQFSSYQFNVNVRVKRNRYITNKELEPMRIKNIFLKIKKNG